jgi:iron complex outermembrane receptor protein
MTQREQPTSTITYAEAVADGPFARLPAGATKLAVGIGARQERLFQNTSAGGRVSRNEYARENVFGFAELSLPLVHRLDLSIAGRYEQYNDFGPTFNQKIGLSWSPADAIKIRGSWGNSFRAPLLVDLDARDTAAGLLSLSDPSSPTGHSVVLAVQGNNAHLRQETATSWTAGADFSARALSGLMASFTYFAIDYRDRVARPGTDGALYSILAEENRWGDPVIIRHPSHTQVDPLCATPFFYGSRSDCVSELPDAIVDIRLRNLATTSVIGLDAALSQSLEVPRGEARWAVDGTYLFKFSQGITRSSPAVTLLNTINSPLKLKARGTLDWYQTGENLPGFGASLTLHYASGYQDNRSVPNRHIGSSSTFDFQVTYRTPKGTGWCDDVEIAGGAVNLFDRPPPFVNTEMGYDVANAEPTGRMLTLLLQKHW